MTALLALLFLVQGRDLQLSAVQDPNPPPTGQEQSGTALQTPQDPPGNNPPQDPPKDPPPGNNPPQDPPKDPPPGNNPPQDPQGQPPGGQPPQDKPAEGQPAPDPAKQEPAKQEPAKQEPAKPDPAAQPNRQGNRPGDTVRNPGARNAGAKPPTGPPAGSQGGQLPVVQDMGDALLMIFDETNDTLDLLSLTKLCQATTKINFVYDAATATALAAAKVQMLGPKLVPKSEFYTFYQNLMFINQFTCTRVGRDETSIVLIQQQGQAQGRGQNQVKAEPTYVDGAELEQYAGQVATQIMTVLHLPNTDVRNLQQSLRVLGGQDTTQNVISVAGTSSVILTGSGSTVAMLARVLKLVDEEAAKEGQIAPGFEIIPLEYASGEDVADMLEQLLEASRRAQQASRQGNPAQGVTAPIQGSGTESKIIVDKRTNSLIVMAMPDDMVHIKELVAQLDVEVVEPERTYHIYALDNVLAEDLAKVLKDFIQDSSRVQPSGATGRAGEGAAQGGGRATGGGSAGANEVVVVPDKTTNSLLIAAGKSRYEEMLDMVRKLDRRQDQVLIETALVELTGRNFRDIGVELGFADIPGADALGGFGVTSFGLSTLQDFNQDGIPEVRVPNFTEGISAGIIDGNDFSLPVLVAAVQQLRDTNVLSVPSVLVNNNGSAKVSTLDELPTTTITATGGLNGQTQENFNGYQEAGITLQISPSISASGYLRLNVFLKVANFLGATSGAIPPPRITREITTSVNVPNGDTMVVGGIMIDNNTHERRQVPWLGDVPVLGWLFARDNDTQDRTTLYFFVTPHIMRDKDFADLSEYSYRIKLNASEVIGADRIQAIDKTLGRIQKEDFGGFEVPLYRSPKRGEVDPASVGIDPVRRSEMLQDSGQPPAEVPSTPPDPTPIPPSTPPQQGN